MRVTVLLLQRRVTHFLQRKADKGEGQAPGLHCKSCRVPGKVETPAPASILCQRCVPGGKGVGPWQLELSVPRIIHANHWNPTTPGTLLTCTHGNCDLTEL